MTPLLRVAFSIIGIPHLGFRMRARSILNQVCSLPREARVLDAGCGYGLYAMTLAERGYRVDAIDIDPGRIHELQRHQAEYKPLAGIDARVGSLSSLPYPDNAYDIIICSDVIEHIADDRAAFSELARVLKRGGTLLLSVPHTSPTSEKIYKRFGHERPGYTKEDISMLAETFDLTLKSTEYYEYAIGYMLFSIHSAIRSAPLLAATFYPFYALYLLERYIPLGVPTGIITVLKKNTTQAHLSVPNIQPPL